MHHDAVTSLSANGSTAFIWKLCCHWLKGLWLSSSIFLQEVIVFEISFAIHKVISFRHITWVWQAQAAAELHKTNCTTILLVVRDDTGNSRIWHRGNNWDLISLKKGSVPLEAILWASCRTKKIEVRVTDAPFANLLIVCFHFQIQIQILYCINNLLPGKLFSRLVE